MFTIPEINTNGRRILLYPSDFPLMLRVAAASLCRDPEPARFRLELVHELGRLLVGNPLHFMTLPDAAENQVQDVGQTGIQILIDQAKAIPELRSATHKLIAEFAARLGAMIDKRGPKIATPADLGRMKDVLK